MSKEATGMQPAGAHTQYFCETCLDTFNSAYALDTVCPVCGDVDVFPVGRKREYRRARAAGKRATRARSTRDLVDAALKGADVVVRKGTRKGGTKVEATARRKVARGRMVRGVYKINGKRAIPPKAIVPGAVFERTTGGKRYTCRVIKERGAVRFKVGNRTYGTIHEAARGVVEWGTNGHTFWHEIDKGA